MKIKLLYLVFISILSTILFSCNDLDDKSLPKEKTKVERMTALYEKYGWEKEDGISEKEFEEFLLSCDYNKMEDFFQLINSLKNPIDLTDKTQFIQTKSSERSFKQTYELQGHHSSAVSSANTYMTVEYDTKSVSVISTEVVSNPSCEWYPEKTGEFYFSNNRCDITVPGEIKYSFIRRDFTMQAYLELYSNGSVKDGKITKFH